MTTIETTKGGTVAIKLCINCRHYLDNRSDRRLSKVQCDHIGNQHINYVQGGTNHFYQSAQVLREDESMCGPEAKWFVEGWPYVEPEEKQSFLVRWWRNGWQA